MSYLKHFLSVYNYWANHLFLILFRCHWAVSLPLLSFHLSEVSRLIEHISFSYSFIFQYFDLLMQYVCFVSSMSLLPEYTLIYREIWLYMWDNQLLPIRPSLGSKYPSVYYGLLYCAYKLYFLKNRVYILTYVFCC